jgi:hypothetical protein
MAKMTLAQQRALASTLSPSKKAGARKLCHECQMQGKGMKETLNKVKNFLGPIFKAVGPVVLKEIAIPLIKKQIGLGLRLAGQGKRKRPRRIR